jgi:hypothetical protein
MIPFFGKMAAVSASRIFYWRKGEATQNFGDFFSELFVRKLMADPLKATQRGDIFRLVGSVIHDWQIKQDLKTLFWWGLYKYPTFKRTIVFWGCGARDYSPLPAKSLAHCLFLGVRGPLTRDVLKLPSDTTIGDPGFLFPLFHPRPGASPAGGPICVPHILDPMDDESLQKATGIGKVVRVSLPPDPDKIFEIADAITSAEFVLAGSLHAAILACAYGVPFAFLDTGHIDCPFKWDDFAASISIPAVFVKNLREARGFYESVQSQIRKPQLLPILRNSPFIVREEMLQRAEQHDSTRQ